MKRCRITMKLKEYTCACNLLTIEGVKISLSSIQDGSYPISRPLYFYVKNQHVGVIPGIDEYVKEFTSKRASGKRGYLKDLGLVPLANPKEAISKVE